MLMRIPARPSAAVLTAAALVTGLLVGGVQQAAAADPTPIGKSNTCVLDSSSGCTATHSLGAVPAAVVGQNAGSSILAVDPALTTATGFRARFTNHDGANWPAGTNARFYGIVSPATAGNVRAAVVQCTVDASSGCTVNHGLGATPAAVVATATTGHIVSIDSRVTTSTTYRIRFTQHTGAAVATGTVVRYNVMVVSSATAPGSVGRVSTCTVSNGSCTINHGLGVKPDGIAVTDGGPSIVSIDPNQTTATSFTVKFNNHDGTPVASANGRFSTLFALPIPVDTVKPGMGGTVWTDAEWPAWEAAMGASENRRTYDSGLPANFEASKAGSANDYEAGRESWWSYKPSIVAGGLSSTAQTALAAFLRTVPVGHEFVLTVWHEPEDQIASGTFTVANWLAAQRQAGAIVDQVNTEKGVNSKLRYASILMGYWTFDTRGHYSQGWRTFTATDFANVDIIGFDPYKWNPGDPSMEALMTRDNSGSLSTTSESAMANAVSWGKTIALPEWGITATGVSDADRAAWITDAYTWAKAWNVAHPGNALTDMTYFHIDDFATPTNPRPTWEVIGKGTGLAEAALRNAMADSRS
jgi:hypothetical protein